MSECTLRLTFVLCAALALRAQPGPPVGPPPPGGPGMGQGDGIWQRDAYFGESLTFDRCFAHQPGDGTYHNHIQPVCLRAQLGDNLDLVSNGRVGPVYREKDSGWSHSPILGWSFDGYPIYGPYGYSDPQDATSPIQRMRSSFQLRDMKQRTSLPDWALSFHNGVSQQLSPSQYGPDVSDLYPLGRYVEDYDYVAGQGDLDQYNGRFAITPEFPYGTYAYYVTLKDDGSPAFPYVMSLQYYGTPTNSRNVVVPGAAQDYFANGVYQQTSETGPQLTSWSTQNSQQFAQAVSGWDPASGPSTTWPAPAPAGARSNGGQTTPALADTQRIRFTSDAVYVNSNNLASYLMGPWFSGDAGGVFQNWPSAQRSQAQIPRAPTVPAAKRMTPGGAIGVLVNGVALFNPLDMSSYSNSAKQDNGPPVAPSITHISAASLESGPVAPGSLVTANAAFSARLATSAATADPTAAPVMTLGGATVNVTDSAGKTQQAAITYASPGKVSYRMPTNMAPGIATVAIAAGGARVVGQVNIVDVYPNLFAVDTPAPGAAQTAQVKAGTLSIFGSGMGNAGASYVTATIGGEAATVSFAGPDGAYPGLDRYDLIIPEDFGGDVVDVVVKVNGKASNPVSITLP
jgi:uncharacterized protein (TIGR03437 family)